MEIDIEACFRFIQTSALEHSTAKGEVVLLEAKLKSVKGALMTFSEESSIAMKEADAYKNPDYMAVAKQLALETAKEAKLNTLIKAAFAKIEIYKSELYTQRKELKNLDVSRG